MCVVEIYDKDIISFPIFLEQKKNKNIISLLIFLWQKKNANKKGQRATL